MENLFLFKFDTRSKGQDFGGFYVLFRIFTTNFGKNLNQNFGTITGWGSGGISVVENGFAQTSETEMKAKDVKICNDLW